MTNEEIAYDKLKKKVFTDCGGFDLNQYSQEYVKRRLNARMMVLGLKLNAWDDYLRILDSDRGEYTNLFNAFSVNVTEFFRDITLWQVLKDKVFPEIIAEKRRQKNNSLRIWSAGCSTCEEAYSISMTLRELLPVNFHVSIYATDIDEDALLKAKAGVYFKESVKNVEKINPELLTKYFTYLPAKGPSLTNLSGDKYKISDQIIQMVVTKKSNFLLDPPPTSQNDIIFCRNAMIYLTQEMKKKLINTFHGALVQNGLLIIGKSELICLEKNDVIYEPVDAKEHIYRKVTKQGSAGN